MVGHKTLIVGSLVLLAAGIAAANNVLVGGSPGLAVSSGSVMAQTSTPSTTTTTPSTVGPSTGTGTGATGTTTGTTGATGTTTSTTPTVVPGTTAGTAAISQIVSITRSVPEGAPVSAFTVPAGQQLVITDILVTNAGTTPACGAAVSPSGTTTLATAAVAGTTALPGTSETGTGVLCVPPQTSLDLGLTTGLEFTAGQSVVLANTSTAATGVTTTATTLHYHLRGFLVSATGV